MRARVYYLDRVQTLFRTTLVAWLLYAARAFAASDDVTKGSAIFAERCALCHSVRDGNGQGPGLAGIVGRTAGTGRGYGYTKALRDSGLRFDAATLDRFLDAPTDIVPGTRMVLAVPEAPDRAALIAYLKTLPASEGSPAAPATAEATPVKPAVPKHLTGKAALGDFRSDGPGVVRHLTVADLPAPFATRSSRNSPTVAEPPKGALPFVPKGFHVEVFAHADNARLMRTAPNGDIFLSETASGKVVVFRAADGASTPSQTSVFADGLNGPFGIAFYPPGPAPKYVVVANNDSVVRFPYANGDMVARGPAETLVPKLTNTHGGHWTRDVVFSKDGAHMFVSVGSASNVAEEMEHSSADQIRDWEAAHGMGATWGAEEGRADVRVFDPDGKNDKVYASGIRNCVGLAFSPAGDLWCSTNERDGLGDDLVPDYLTSVRPGAFYGWPWFYLGDHEDPRQAGARPDLRGKITVPDVLVQPHSASLEMLFYDGAMFPAPYKGDAFAAFHGSWNRSKRTGYKVVRVRMKDGKPTGEYEDFLTGLVLSDDQVWARPVGVTVAHDGALLVSEDGNGTIWRVTWTGGKTK